MKKIKPIISEKTVALAKKGQFAIEVSSNLTKPQIVQMLKEIFNLNAIDVKISNRKAHTAKKAKGIATQKMVKKAYVSLKKNEKFPGFEIAFEEKKDKKKLGKDEAKK